MPAPEEVQVEMTHPDVDAPAHVAAAAVKAWEASGWKVADQDAADDAVDEAKALEEHHDQTTGAVPEKASGSTKKRG